MEQVFSMMKIKIILNESFRLMIKFIKTNIKIYESKITSVLFLLFIVSFAIDRIINYFFHFPFFVIISIIIFPILVIATKKESNNQQFFILIISFALITILNSIIYIFNVRNISDLLFILLFITTYFYYKENLNSLKITNIFIFFAVSVFLFSFAINSVNLKDINNSKYSSWLSWADSQELRNINKNGNTLEWEKKPLDKLKLILRKFLAISL